MPLTIARIHATTISILAGLALAACATPQNAAVPTVAPAAPTSAPAPTVAPAAPTSAPAPTVAPAVPTNVPEPTTVAATATPEAPAGLVADPEDEAAVALEQFLIAMHEGRYADAAALYGGDYGMLQAYNPYVPIEDHVGLLRQACEVNGFMCLAPASITRNSSDATVIYYDVTFFAPDGSIFSIPTAGDSADAHSSFGLMVQMRPEGPRAITLPPYVS